MDMNTAGRLVGLVSGILLGTPAQAADSGPAHKWRIDLNHRTENHGTLILRIAPVDGTPIDVERKFPADMNENHAARLLCDTLQTSLDEQTCHIERDDVEDCLVKARHNAPKFVVTLVSSTLRGLAVRIEHD